MSSSAGSPVMFDFETDEGTRKVVVGMQLKTQDQAIDAFIRRKLEAAGVRPTRQRVDLGRAIFGGGDWHFTAEMIYQETRTIRFAPTLGTIYNTLNEFARCGLLREIAIYDAKLWYDTKTGPHFHFYREIPKSCRISPTSGCPRSTSPRPRACASPPST